MTIFNPRKRLVFQMHIGTNNCFKSFSILESRVARNYTDTEPDMLLPQPTVIRVVFFFL